MAKLNTYLTDTSIQDGDKWIGTDSLTGKTRNFTPQGLADNFNDTGKIGIGGQIPYVFSIQGSPNRNVGTITFPTGGGNGTAFSAINALVLSKTTNGGIAVSEYLQYLEDNVIFIYQLDNVNNFGKFSLTSLADRSGETTFFDATLIFSEGNGSLITGKTYGIVQGPSDVDKNFVFTQGSAASTWTVNHNLEKFPSVMVVDSGNNVVIGDITYTNTNSLTVSFSSAFSGKAYIN
tara:strand:+ start:9459 stop:10160 length:702 start_codon:yes stop_codon:yes gene_type:complete